MMLSFFITACGGGSLEKEGSIGGNGDTSGNVTEKATIVALNFEDRVITVDTPLEVIATVTDSSGSPVVRQEVSFTTTLGTFIPSTGSALTDANGTAVIKLTAGNIEGAGTVIAT